jgi:hypothetical protein
MLIASGSSAHKYLERRVEREDRIISSVVPKDLNLIYRGNSNAARLAEGIQYV